MAKNVAGNPATQPKAVTGALGIAPYQVKEDEEYMNPNQLQHFRNILEAMKQNLMQEADVTVDHLRGTNFSNAPDPSDRASQEELFTFELRESDRKRKLLKRIESTLDLITKHEYGYCEDCGAEIGIRRLEARPMAMKCIDCKTFAEIREKQEGGG